MTINFSDRALYNKSHGSWIELCNNDCGAWVYWDLETRTVRNAETTKKDSPHSETCSKIKYLKDAASSMNWFPSYSFLEEAETFIAEAEKNLEAAQHNYDNAMRLKEKLEHRKGINAQAKIDWDIEKNKKTLEKQEKRKVYP